MAQTKRQHINRPSVKQVSMHERKVQTRRFPFRSARASQCCMSVVLLLHMQNKSLGVVLKTNRRTRKESSNRDYHSPAVSSLHTLTQTYTVSTSPPAHVSFTNPPVPIKMQTNTLHSKEQRNERQGYTTHFSSSTSIISPSSSHLAYCRYLVRMPHL